VRCDAQAWARAAMAASPMDDRQHRRLGIMAATSPAQRVRITHIGYRRWSRTHNPRRSPRPSTHGPTLPRGAFRPAGPHGSWGRFASKDRRASPHSEPKSGGEKEDHHVEAPDPHHGSRGPGLPQLQLCTSMLRR
jgi:hypothetical protein